MNILFLTLSNISDINERGIYQDLMRKFIREGHQVFIVSPSERRFNKSTQLINQGNAKILKVKTLNIQKTSVVEKGIGTLLIEYQYFWAIKNYFSNLSVDLLLYSTPPITFIKVIQKIKRKFNAKSYLLLKDIFPQNAIDFEMIKQNSLIHRYFLKKEKALYQLSDYIGCMSPANVTYLLGKNPYLDPKKVEVNPNSIELTPDSTKGTDTFRIRKKYQIPQNKKVFIYGGNLGKPQGIDFLLETILACKRITEAFFLIVGSGTEYDRIEKWFQENIPANAKLLSFLPKIDYDLLVKTSDVGLIFLDKRFTIPNYPSRLLSYLENRLPIITATDPNSDIGKIAEENQYGFQVLNGDIVSMMEKISYFVNNKKQIKVMGEYGFTYLTDNYTVDHSYSIIMRHFR